MLCRFKSYRNEIWHFPYKYASIDGVGFSIWHYTFKMAAMKSFHAETADTWGVNTKRLLGAYATASTVPDLQYIPTCCEEARWTLNCYRAKLFTRSYFYLLFNEQCQLESFWIKLIYFVVNAHITAIHNVMPIGLILSPNI